RLRRGHLADRAGAARRRALRAAAAEVAPRGRRRRRAATCLVPALEREERQLGLAFAAQHGEVDLHARDPALIRERDRLRLDRLRDEVAAAVGARLVGADAVEVARQLLDGVDRPDTLDLDG